MVHIISLIRANTSYIFDSFVTIKQSGDQDALKELVQQCEDKTLVDLLATPFSIVSEPLLTNFFLLFLTIWN